MSGIVYYNSVATQGFLDDLICICKKMPNCSTVGGANGWVDSSTNSAWSVPTMLAEGDDWQIGMTAGLSFYSWDGGLGPVGLWGTFVSLSRLPAPILLPFVSEGAQELDPSSLASLPLVPGGMLGYAMLNVAIPNSSQLVGTELWLQSASFHVTNAIQLSRPRRITVR